MKKLMTLTVLALFLFCAQGFAQRVSERSEDLKRLGNQPAFAMDLDHPARTVEKVLGQRLRNDGLRRGRSSRGAVKHERVTYLPIFEGPIDLYTKVTGNRRRSTVFIFVSRGYENFVTSSTDPIIGANVTEFLNSLVEDVQAYEIRNQISAQERVVRRAQRDHDNLVRDQERRQERMARDAQRSETNLNTQREKLNRLNSRSR